MKTTVESLARLKSLVRRGTLTVAVATLASGAPAYATTIATPAMFTASDTSDILRCAAVNVGSNPVANVKVELVNIGGGVAKTAVGSDPLPPAAPPAAARPAARATPQAAAARRSTQPRPSSTAAARSSASRGARG